MKIKIKIIISAILLSIAPGVLAAKYGIGMSARSGETEIYLPIDITSQFRLEPSIQYSQNKSSVSSSGSDIVDDRDSKVTTYMLTLGAFYQYHVHNAVTIYSGIRAGYFESDSTFNSLGSETSLKGDGYSVAPTLGIEYWFIDSFSIAGEVGYVFNKSEFQDNITAFDTYQFDNESQTTMSRLILRYFF